MTVRRILAIALVLVTALALPAPGSAARKEKKVDLIWVHPQLDEFRIERIAMLPVSTFDKNVPAEKLVEGMVSASLREKGYRWVSVTTARELLRHGGGSDDSLLKLVNRSVLDQGRLDSLLAPSICGRLRSDAVLAVRVDQWEQNQLEWDQSGKPTTSVQIRAALVDSSGTLLWTASGSQTGEGPYREADRGTYGVTGGGLERKPVSGQGGAPSYAEVLNPLLTRWAPQFPAHTAAAADSAGAAAPPKTSP